MTAAIHSIVDTAREAIREAEQTVIHVEAIITKVQAQIAEMRHNRDLWHDLAKAWFSRRANRRNASPNGAHRLAERAAIRAEGAVTTR